MFENSERQYQERFETQANEIDNLKIKISILQEELNNKEIVSFLQIFIEFHILKIIFLSGFHAEPFLSSAWRCNVDFEQAASRLGKACKPSFHVLSGFLGLKKLGLPDQSLACRFEIMHKLAKEAKLFSRVGGFSGFGGCSKSSAIAH